LKNNNTRNLQACKCYTR